MIIDKLNRVYKYLRYSPILLTYLLKGKKDTKVQEDLSYAMSICKWHKASSRTQSFLNYVCFLPEWRILYLYRIGKIGKLLEVFYPNRNLTIIKCNNIEGGLFLNHAHSTIINASHIGRNCQVWHNVTIGKKFTGGDS